MKIRADGKQHGIKNQLFFQPSLNLLQTNEKERKNSLEQDFE